jgi:hypothetical protein
MTKGNNICFKYIKVPADNININNNNNNNMLFNFILHVVERINKF